MPSIDAWLEELAQFEPERPDGWMTLTEMTERSDRSREYLRVQLGEAVRAGRIEVARVRIRAISGIMSSVPAYRIKASNNGG